MSPEVRASAIAQLANELLTVKEYASVTRIHPERVRQLCRAGQLAGAVRVHGQWRILFSLQAES